MDKTLRCSHCRAVIGEHESMIVLRCAEEAWEVTTLSASASSLGGECYHRHCYALAFSQLRSSGNQ